MKETNSCDYDFIILDPPAFTKSSATVRNAYKG
jgi:23S rRNA (cytosine1962-C5)-methyltransferase